MSYISRLLVNLKSMLRRFTLMQRILLLGILTVFTVLISTTQFLILQGECLDHKLAFVVRGWPVVPGDLIHIKDHVGFYKPKPAAYVKKLMGLSGDRMEIKDQHMYVNGIDVGFVRTHTKDGRKLTPIQASRIPQGYVFVMATHPYSFDSRYQEFGLIKLENVQGKAWGFL